MLRTGTVLALALALTACSKTDQPSGGAASATTASAPASATAAASAPASASESASAAATASAPASASATAAAPASASAIPVVASAGPALANPSGAGECGKAPLPNCPLQGWMKENMQPPVNAGNSAALGAALEKSVSFAPPGYTNWASIAKDGAKAAKAGDIPAAKQSCRTCHDQYKTKYKAELRTRKI